MRGAGWFLVLVIVAVVILWVATRSDDARPVETVGDLFDAPTEESAEPGGSVAPPPEEALPPAEGGPEPGVGTTRTALADEELTGSVVEEESGAPVAGARVHLRRDREALAVATSDAAGRFVIAVPGAEPCRLHLSRLRDFEPHDPVRVDPGALPAELVLRLRRRPSDVVRGRIVDAQTGEPVPALAFDLERPETEQVEGLESDSEGRFVSSRSHTEGRLVLRLRGVSGSFTAMERTVFLEHVLDPADPVEHEVAVRVGPTYRLALELPAGVGIEGLEAILDSEWPRESVWGSTERRAPLRPGAPPWVRFPALGFEEPAPPWQLTVVAQGGTLRGAARVESIVGVHPELVRLRLQAAGSLTGRLTADGEPVSWTFLELEDSRGVLATHGPLEGESYRIDGLEPGEYVVRVYGRAHELGPLRARVEPGEATTLDLALRGRPPAGELAGIVRSTSGEAHAGVRIFARAADRERLLWSDRVDWEVGASEGSFRFEGLPAGEYRISLHVGGDTRVEPRSLSARPPDSGLVFVVRDDDEAARTYAVKALDGGTRKCVSGIVVDVRPGPGTIDMRMSTTGCEVELGRVYGVDEHMEWVLSADGYERRWGDERTFLEEGEESEENENRWSLAVELRRGWSGRVLVRDAEGTPLPGVEIRFDDGPPAATDDAGLLVARRPERPRLLAVRYGAWRIVGGDASAACADPAGSGAPFADAGFEIVVEMGPP